MSGDLELLADGGEVRDGDVAAAIDAGAAMGEPNEVEPGKHYVVSVPPGGSVAHLDLDLDDYRDRPRRKTGTFYAHDAESFVGYLRKHARPETEVWADVSRFELTAVINAHGSSSGPGWGDHRLRMELRATPPWEAWMKHNGDIGQQSVFAEHLEDRLVDVVEPPGADMLELAQSIQATIGVDFKASRRLANGERQLEYRETVETRAGRTGQLDVPELFAVALAPFEGADLYRVVARLRVRIESGSLRIGYVLDRPEEVKRTAFLDVVAAVGERLAPVLDADDGAPVILRGKPA